MRYYKFFPAVRCLLTVVCYVLFLHTGMAQQNNDTAAVEAAKSLLNITSDYPDSVLTVTEKLLLQSQKTENKQLAAYAYKVRGYAWVEGKGSYSKGISDLVQAIGIFEQLHDDQEIMKTYLVLAVCYSNTSEFVKSAESLGKADSLAKKLNNKSAEAYVKRQMGILYSVQNQHDQAIPHFQESMTVFKSLKDTIGFFHVAVSLAQTYVSNSQPGKSLLVLQESSNMLNSYNGEGVKLYNAMLMENFGEAYYALKLYDNSLEYYGKAYKIFADIDNTAQIAYVARLMGRSSLALKRYTEAENYLMLSYRLSDSLEQTDYILDVADELSNLFQERNNWKEAYHWGKVKDSAEIMIQRKEQSKTVAELQAKYEADQRENEIALLKKSREISDATVQRQRIITLSSVVLALLLLGGIALLVNRHRLKQRLREMQLRDDIAADLHDEVGSSLSSINMLSQVAAQQDTRTEMQKDMLDRISTNAQEVIEKISDMVWMIKPGDEDGKNLLARMERYAYDMCSIQNIPYTYAGKEVLQTATLSMQQRKNVYLIFKEALNNAIKSSGTAKVDIHFSLQNNRLKLAIQDFGKGFDTTAENFRNGNGLDNMRNRAKEMNGTLSISSQPGEGTIVALDVAV